MLTHLLCISHLNRILFGFILTLLTTAHLTVIHVVMEHTDNAGKYLFVIILLFLFICHLCLGWILYGTVIRSLIGIATDGWRSREDQNARCENCYIF